ncbi:secretion protein HlyD [Ktedonobacteria bacterium brp13]|nr:secretion protein HlyD [Ktedonobacteria bacterium brp13]
MRRTVLVTTLIFIAILAVLGGGAWFFFQNYQYYSTDDAQVTGPMLTVSSPAAGQLNTLSVKLGDKVTSGQILGTVTAPPVAGATGATSKATATVVNITSPIAGTIVQVPAVQGQMVAPGVGLVEVADLSNLTVTAYVDEGALRNVKVDQSVDVTVDAYSGTTYSGHVQQIVQATAGSFSLLPTSDPTSGNFTKVSQRVPVIISLDGIGSNDLVPGLSAEVTIHLH